MTRNAFWGLCIGICMASTQSVAQKIENTNIQTDNQKNLYPTPISMKLPMGNLYILSEATQVFITSEQYKQTRIRKYWIN